MKTGWKTAVRYTIGAATIGLVALGGVQASLRSTAAALKMGSHPIDGPIHGATSGTSDAVPTTPRISARPEESTRSVSARTDEDHPRFEHPAQAPGLNTLTATWQDADGHRAGTIASPAATKSDLGTAKKSDGGMVPNTAPGAASSAEADLQGRGHPGLGGGTALLLPGAQEDATTLPARGLFDGRPGATGAASESFHVSARGGASPRPAAEQSTHPLNSALPVQSPVPEPDTWVMLACGALMVIGATSRRRTRSV